MYFESLSTVLHNHHVYFSLGLNILTTIALDLRGLYGKSSHQSFLLVSFFFFFLHSQECLLYFGVLPVPINFYISLLSFTEATVEILLI